MLRRKANRRPEGGRPTRFIYQVGHPSVSRLRSLSLVQILPTILVTSGLPRVNSWRWSRPRSEANRKKDVQGVLAPFEDLRMLSTTVGELMIFVHGVGKQARERGENDLAAEELSRGCDICY
jgi:hypothetical protein